MDNTPRVLAGRYEVGELIGRGGMAEVHIGHDTRLGRTVAIKVLRSDLARDPSFLARFRREAQSAAALNHPAIVAVYDTGEDTSTDASGQQVHIPFIVMEYVEGHTVRDILADGAAVPIEEAVEITVGILSALEYSHHAGIVHRDIKPANVMITPTGAVKVMDFGIARAMADSAATMTQGQAVIGTAQYLSPEQARGEQVDARSDLYSTGCVLFELLTGRPPFVGDSPVALAYQHVGQQPQRPSEIANDVPEVLDRIVLSSLAKDRNDRYSSAGEFRSDLESAVRGGNIMAPALGAAAAGAAAAYGATQVLGDPQGTQVMSPAGDPSPWGQTGLPTDQTAVGTAVPPGEEEDEGNRKWLMWTLIGVGVLALAAILFFWLTSGEDEPDLVAVPELTANMSPTEAQRLVEGAGLVYSERVDDESDEPENTLTRSDPASGEQVAEGSTVLVYFSGGPETFSMPDVTGRSLEEAEQQITDAGLEVGEREEQASSSVDEGDVISTDPAPGNAVNPGDTVDIVWSNGQVELPDLIGQDQEDAEAALEDLGLNVRISSEPVQDTNDVGKVVNQSPEGGTVDQDTTVELTIGEEPEAEMVQVPNVEGMSAEDAESALGGQANLTAVQRTESSEEYCPGFVARQDPPAGTELEIGSDVTIIVSTGAEGQDCSAGEATPAPPEDDGPGLGLGGDGETPGDEG
ncbi:serine/threonine-protein kinase [Isoptericola sp. CG 20/1183]|uniref:non-specific serine/threonine protein kinase n=1 Tax=Isoptericola halotolerans TaxID=300560 RepID=A0ABX5EJG3_9MICO|nr:MULTISPECIES: Stk1 family PASTA domain-containing Ser/Thr kinase [Isoptericola]PRZ08777.1 serine/threonine-protein kinase [Isoptericola halotolerans]PRZ10776.1 serine/threonine-protein kinase [Isoptericola sp. CG 20/1183]